MEPSMDFTGEYRIPAPQQKVWEALNDASILKVCIDGCESLRWVNDHELDCVVSSRIGPVTARFAGKLWLTDVQAPQSYVLHGQGQGGAAGFAKGSAAVSLVADGSETLLRYRTSANMGGMLADVGAQLVQGAADKVAAQFFERFAQRLTVALLAAQSAATSVDDLPAAETSPALPPIAGAAALLADWDELVSAPLDDEPRSLSKLSLPRPLWSLSDPRTVILPAGWGLCTVIVGLLLFLK